MNEDHETKTKVLVTHAATVAVTSRDSSCEFYPQLRRTARFHMWDFFATVASVWVAYSQIDEDVEMSLRRSTKTTVQNALDEFHPSAFGALKDLDNLVLRILSREPDITKRPTHTPLAVGTWFVWNLTNKQPIQDEPQIAGFLGRVVVQMINGYWRV